jgi:SPP1 family predicted phage head-tail adaptor
MRAGKLRHRISIERSIETQDSSYNEPLLQWVLFAEVSASITPLNGRELIRAKQVELEVDTEITIRYLDGLSPKMRIIYRGRIFEILSIINTEERNRELRLLCSEVKP